MKQLYDYDYIIYQPELHKGHSPKVTIVRLTDKIQLNLFPKGSTSAGTGVVPPVNEVVPLVLKTSTSSGTGVVPEVVHLKKQSSQQCKTNECETHAQKYPTVKESLAWFDKEHANTETARVFFYCHPAASTNPIFSPAQNTRK